MINVENLTTEMLQTLFPDVASPGFSTGVVFAGLLALVALVLFFVALDRKWHEAWGVFYVVLAAFSGFVCLAALVNRKHVWRDVTLPGALSRDPEAAVVVERVRKDVEWINKRSEQRRKKQELEKLMKADDALKDDEEDET